MPVLSPHLLVLRPERRQPAVGRRAQALAAAVGAEVELLHVVEFVPVEPMGETLMPAVQIEDELLERARQRLRDPGASWECRARPAMSKPAM